MSTFKIAVTTIFAVCIVFGIAVFAFSRGSNNTVSATVVIWGTVSEDIFDVVYKNSSLLQNKDLTLTYVRKDPNTFDDEFIEALADGTGPDVVIMREDSLYTHRNRILTIPYNSYPERTFKDLFIEEGEMFLTPEGVQALPFIVDPLVMYWNRDLFSSNSISQPPKYWDEIYGLINKLTTRDSSANILQSAIALGEWRNITNAKEIISTLLLQAGTPITSRLGADFISVLNDKFNAPVVPSQSAVNFYTQFSNPTSAAYTWNRSLPTSLNFFLSGKLALYIGFASEIFSIQQKNSNLNFDVALLPQIRETNKASVFAHMYALAVVKQSKQVSPAFTTIVGFTEPEALQALGAVTNLPPVRRDLLVTRPTDAFRSVFYDSAFRAQGWLDPEPTSSSAIFRDMIEGITSGRVRTSEALNKAHDQLTEALK